MKFPQRPKDDQEERPEEGSGHPRLFFLSTTLSKSVNLR
jgi:hypothetical protein